MNSFSTLNVSSHIPYPCGLTFNCPASSLIPDSFLEQCISVCLAHSFRVGGLKYFLKQSTAALHQHHNNYYFYTFVNTRVSTNLLSTLLFASSSTRWTLLCILRYDLRASALSHKLHEYGFTPVWALVAYVPVVQMDFKMLCNRNCICIVFV